MTLNRKSNHARWGCLAMAWQNPKIGKLFFADGTRFHIEQQSLRTTRTGMKRGQRGMFGPTVQAGLPSERCFSDLYSLECTFWKVKLGRWIMLVRTDPGTGGIMLSGTRMMTPNTALPLNLYKLGKETFNLPFSSPYPLLPFWSPSDSGQGSCSFHDAPFTAPIGEPMGWM